MEGLGSWLSIFRSRIEKAWTPESSICREPEVEMSSSSVAVFVGGVREVGEEEAAESEKKITPPLVVSMETQVTMPAPSPCWEGWRIDVEN